MSLFLFTFLRLWPVSPSRIDYLELAIERRQLGHFVRLELEIEDIHIFPDSFFANAFGNDGHVAIESIAQENLRSRHLSDEVVFKDQWISSPQALIPVLVSSRIA